MNSSEYLIIDFFKEFLIISFKIKLFIVNSSLSYKLIKLLIKIFKIHDSIFVIQINLVFNNNKEILTRALVAQVLIMLLAILD